MLCPRTARERRFYFSIFKINKSLHKSILPLSNHAITFFVTRVLSADTYGSAGLGADLTQVAWPLLKQVFNCDSRVVSTSLSLRPDIGGTELGSPQRVPKSTLVDHPVDLLVVGQGDTAVP